MITVSAIIPVYNVKRYLNRCLDSVLNQTRTFDEIIIVNDGSTDGCSEICESYAKKYKKIRLLNKPNGGLVSAWMEGLNHVSSSYICFIDSDDYISADYLESLINGCDKEIDMVCMNATQAFDTGEKREFRINGLDAGVYMVNEELKGRILSDHGAFIRPIASCRWSKLIRAEIVQKYAKYCTTEISYGEDQQLTLGILLGCNVIRVIDDYKYFYQYNTSSILNTYKADLWEKIELLMETISLIPEINKIPDYPKQFNTQYLLYFAECLRNEFYNGSLTKQLYDHLLSTKGVKVALSDYYDQKLRKIDRVIIGNAKRKRFVNTIISLKLYKALYRLRGIPG